MKNLIIITLSILCLCSCEKFKKDNISYPKETEYGINILNDSVNEMNIINPDNNKTLPNYAISAILEKKSSIKVIISYEGDFTIWNGFGCTYWWIKNTFPIEVKNWKATEYADVGTTSCDVPSGHIQTLTNTSTGECNLRIQFAPITDLTKKIKIEIFENGDSTPTKTKYIKLKM